jgi:hypothetical protein
MKNYCNDISSRVAFGMMPYTLQAASCLTRHRYLLLEQSITGVGAFYV